MLRIEPALAKRINILIIGHGMERAYIYSMPHRLNIPKHALGERLRLQDLAAICVTLAPPAERLFRAAISTEYLVDDEVLRGRLLYELDGAIVALQAERTRRYFKKSRRTCTEFVETKAETHRMLHLRKADPEIVQALVAGPEALMAEGERVKSGNTCTVQRVLRGGRSYILKRYNQQPFIDRVRKLFSDSRALTELVIGMGVGDGFYSNCTGDRCL
jgi:hypothetical protein